eukprot:gene15726-21845_t
MATSLSSHRHPVLRSQALGESNADSTPSLLTFPATRTTKPPSRSPHRHPVLRPQALGESNIDVPPSLPPRTATQPSGVATPQSATASEQLPPQSDTASEQLPTASQQALPHPQEVGSVPLPKVPAALKTGVFNRLWKNRSYSSKSPQADPSPGSQDATPGDDQPLGSKRLSSSGMKGLISKVSGKGSSSWVDFREKCETPPRSNRVLDGSLPPTSAQAQSAEAQSMQAQSLQAQAVQAQSAQAQSAQAQSVHAEPVQAQSVQVQSVQAQSDASSTRSRVASADGGGSVDQSSDRSSRNLGALVKSGSFGHLVKETVRRVGIKKAPPPRNNKIVAVCDVNPFKYGEEPTPARPAAPSGEGTAQGGSLSSASKPNIEARQDSIAFPFPLTEVSSFTPSSGTESPPVASPKPVASPLPVALPLPVDSPQPVDLPLPVASPLPVSSSPFVASSPPVSRAPWASTPPLSPPTPPLSRPTSTPTRPPGSMLPPRYSPASALHSGRPPIPSSRTTKPSGMTESLPSLPNPTSGLRAQAKPSKPPRRWSATGEGSSSRRPARRSLQGDLDGHLDVCNWSEGGGVSGRSSCEGSRHSSLPGGVEAELDEVMQEICLINAEDTAAVHEAEERQHRATSNSLGASSQGHQRSCPVETRTTEFEFKSAGNLVEGGRREAFASNARGVVVKVLYTLTL